eukprot:1154657-Pelagomonas_calceolata.AAC.3
MLDFIKAVSASLSGRNLASKASAPQAVGSGCKQILNWQAKPQGILNKDPHLASRTSRKLR